MRSEYAANRHLSAAANARDVYAIRREWRQARAHARSERNARAWCSLLLGGLPVALFIAATGGL